MMRVQSGLAGDVRAVAGIEGRLAVTLHQAAEELAHSECLGPEERAEVYTILEAIQADSELHRRAVVVLTGCLAERPNA